MAETLATLVDKLVIVHLKYWHFQDKVQEYKRTGEYKKFAEVQTLIDKCNQNRNVLMAEIDSLYEKDLANGKPLNKFELVRFHDHSKANLNLKGKRK